MMQRPPDTLLELPSSRTQRFLSPRWKIRLETCLQPRSPIRREGRCCGRGGPCKHEDPAIVGTQRRGAILQKLRVFSAGFLPELRKTSGHPRGWEAWLPELWSALGAPSVPLVREIPTPSYKVSTSPGKVDSPPVPDDDIIPPGAAKLKLLTNTLLTPETKDYDRDIRHYEFEIKGTPCVRRWGCGAASFRVLLFCLLRRASARHAGKDHCQRFFLGRVLRALSMRGVQCTAHAASRLQTCRAHAGTCLAHVSAARSRAWVRRTSQHSMPHTRGGPVSHATR